MAPMTRMGRRRKGRLEWSVACDEKTPLDGGGEIDQDKWGQERREGLDEGGWRVFSRGSERKGIGVRSVWNESKMETPGHKYKRGPRI